MGVGGGNDEFGGYNRLFVQECEAVSVRVGSGLQSAISTQMREFLVVYQDDRIRSLADCLEKDKWGAKEFEESRQQSLDRILRAATGDPDEWLSIGRLWELRSDPTPPSPTTTTAEAPTTATEASTTATTTITEAPNGTPPPQEEKKNTHAIVDGQRFILPESGLLVLREIESYLRLVVLMHGCTQDLGTGIHQFLQLFNSRTFQLILGAGATRSAGLRSITTKHLAMASQALSIIATIIPYIRETLRRHNPVITADFDKLKRTTQEYQDEIHNKLISIMGDRARMHTNYMKQADWDVPQPAADDPTAGKYYMDTMCRETLVLHKVLARHLPPEQVMGIMGPVFRDYAQRLIEGYSGATIRTEDGRKRYVFFFSSPGA